MRNMLDRLPKREQAEAKELLRDVVHAPTRAEALLAREAFRKRYGPWYPKAVATLEEDNEVRTHRAAGATARPRCRRSWIRSRSPRRSSRPLEPIGHSQHRTLDPMSDQVSISTSGNS